jgi:hypothetical protein
MSGSGPTAVDRENPLSAYSVEKVAMSEGEMRCRF